MHVKTGDLVTVIAGNCKGQKGKILQVLTAKDRVIVEGVNKHHKWIRKTQDNPKGGEMEQEMPIHVSNVALWDEKEKKILKRRPRG